MATDLEKLIVQLSADYKQYENAMKRATGVMNKQAREIEKRWTGANKNLNAISQRMSHSIVAPLAGISAALSVREVARYADAWTVAGNKVASASQLSGMQARSLEDLNVIAAETRSGISETVDLYAKLMRSTAGVAQSEMEVARATEIVNKAFKAGGAAASEQAAGILQLSQGLGSGVLQGDELRSVRENAPILAQAIADYYKVSIAGLKKLGEEGQITSDGVFKAILAAGPKIEAAFATTNSTISEGITRVSNAFTQYIGQSDASLSASQRLVGGLTALADNFDTVADVTLKVAGIIAGALIGRSIAGMIKELGLGAVAITRFVAAARAATTLSGLSTALGGLSVAAGPIGAVIGVTAATAMVLYADSARQAEQRTENLRTEMEQLGLYARPAAAAVDAVSASVDQLSDRERLRRIRDLRLELDAVRGNGGLSASFFGNSGELGKIIDDARRGIGLSAGYIGPSEFEGGDVEALKSARELAIALRDQTVPAKEALALLRQIETVDLSKPAKALIADLEDVASLLASGQLSLEAIGGSQEMEAANYELGLLRSHLEGMRDVQGIDDPIVESLLNIIAKAEEGGDAAAEASEELVALGTARPEFGGLISAISIAIGWLATLRAEAQAAKAEVAAVGGGKGGTASVNQQRSDYVNSRIDGERVSKENEAFIAEQRRRNALSKEAMAIEDETNRLLKERPDLLKSQADMLARENLAAREGRKGGAGKGGGGAGKAVERYDDQILKEIEGMKAETAEMGRIGLAYDKYGLSVDRARQEAELLQNLQNKGVPITAALRQQVAALSDDWLAAAEANAKAKDRHEEFQSALEDFRSTQQDAFTGLITGAHGFKDAVGMVIAKLAEMAASRAFDSLWESGLGGASGGFLSGLFGFSSGGFTGAGGKYQPAGVVHKGEYVMDAETVRRAGGPAAFDAMRRGLKGYANGGAVGTPSIPNLARLGGAPAAPKITIHNNAPGAVVRTESVSADEVRIIVAEGITKYDKGMRPRVLGIVNKPRKN